MELYNCETERELELKEIVLEELTDVELMELGVDTGIDFKRGILKDENIVIDMLVQIVIEQTKRKVGER